MKEFMYDISSLAMAGILLVSMAVVIEVGYRVGTRFQNAANTAAKDQIFAVQGSLLGILALLLGFTFSLALQRFDSRSEAVVDEANAIGTVYLRAQLLPASVQERVLPLLGDYVDQRVQTSSVSIIDESERSALITQSGQTQAALWSHARRAAALDPNPVTTGLFIQALNELIDSFGKRDAALNRHVPELVLMLLYGTFVMTGAILGYASGVSGHRPSFVAFILVALIVVLVFIILDLDRPRRGLIEVDQKILIDLQTAIRADVKLTTQGPRPAALGTAAAQ